MLPLLCILECNFFLLTVDCGTLNDPDNGQVTHTTGTTYEKRAIYSCNTGYTLVGDSTRTCQATGTWSGSEPTCQGMLLLIFSHPVKLYNILVALVFALPLSR